MHERQTVWVVDDEESVATLVAKVLTGIGEFECRVFSSSSEFLAALKPGVAACVVSDVRMPNIDGPELQKKLLEIDDSISIVFLTGYADVPTTVQLMEQGAVTLLQKPYEHADLLAAVRRAVRRSEMLRKQRAELTETEERLQRLSSDEREVLECMVGGLTNKAIAYKLALSPRTLDRRRSSILQTMGVASVVELAALLERLRARRM
ncbi:MAG: response regulator transcription factor [Pirellulaceae bacterium]|nr:response regulator transcription factor [Pirellulaceae bacterium]